MFDITYSISFQVMNTVCKYRCYISFFILSQSKTDETMIIVTGICLVESVI